jgi:hypothetical protein
MSAKMSSKKSVVSKETCLSKLTVVELKKLCDENGFKYLKTDKKADLIKGLKEIPHPTFPVSFEKEEIKKATKKTSSPPPKPKVAKKPPVAKSKSKKNAKKAPSKNAKKAPSKNAKKAPSKSKGITIYILFDGTQFGNSSDTLHELDYAVAGVFKTKENAFKSFYNNLIEREVEGTEKWKFLDESGELIPGVLSGKQIDSILEDFGWTIMKETLL